jgi:hypothetical protein
LQTGLPSGFCRRGELFAFHPARPWPARQTKGEIMDWLIDEVFAQAKALADELVPFRGDTQYALLPDRLTCLVSRDPLAQYRGSTTEEVGIGAVFLALRPIYNRLVAGLKRAEKELQTFPPTVADEVRRLQHIVNGTHGKIGFADVGKHFANSELGAVGERGWEAVLRHRKPLPFPSADSDSDDNELFAFYLSGTGYYIAGFGEHGHVSNLKGFQQIYLLIQTPGNPVPMLTLVEADEDERIAVDKRSQQPMLDPRAKQELYDKIAEEKADLEQAEFDNNNVEANHCREEIEKLETELRKATGLGGKSRDLNTNFDKLRSRIAGTLKTSYEKLQAANPPMKLLANHFELSISADGTGKAYIYRPALNPPPEWDIEPKK